MFYFILYVVLYHLEDMFVESETFRKGMLREVVGNHRFVALFDVKDYDGKGGGMFALSEQNDATSGHLQPLVAGETGGRGFRHGVGAPHQISTR